MKGDSIKRVIDHLHRIAIHNDESFSYGINIVIERGRLVYYFWCKECAEGHEFIGSRGTSIDEAMDSISQSDLESACRDWGYEFSKDTAP